MTLQENLEYLASVGKPVLVRSYTNKEWMININIPVGLSAGKQDILFTKRDESLIKVVEDLVSMVKQYFIQKNK